MYESHADERRVFARTRGGLAEVSLGGESWDVGAVETDDAGTLRLQGWTTEVTLDVDGTTLKLRTADGARTSVDTRKLATCPDRETP